MVSVEAENIKNAIRAIGESKLTLNEALIDEIRMDLVERGYDAAIVHAQQAYLAEDLNTEIVRVLTICRRYGLSARAAAQVLDCIR